MKIESLFKDIVHLKWLPGQVGYREFQKRRPIPHICQLIGSWEQNALLFLEKYTISRRRKRLQLLQTLILIGR